MYTIMETKNITNDVLIEQKHFETVSSELVNSALLSNLSIN